MPNDQATRMPLHASLWEAPPRHAEIHIVAALLGGLALDAALGWPGQLAADAWTLALFAWLLYKGGGAEKRALLACLAIALPGEAFLSLGWGLYDYRFHNIPVFVPPGHALLMTLGILLARRLPGWCVWPVPLLALPYVAAGWWLGWDTLGALLFMAFFICLIKGRAQTLYATMFVLSLLLELYGTALGNWRWQPMVPWLALSNTNPPLCSGAFYCMLDLLVLAAIKLVVPPPGVRRAGESGAPARH
jgi:hypothetical protein